MISYATAHKNIRKNKTQTLSFCTQHIFGTYNGVQPDFCYGVAARASYALLLCVHFT